LRPGAPNAQPGFEVQGVYNDLKPQMFNRVSRSRERKAT
jgi:hypothetical protein